MYAPRVGLALLPLVVAFLNPAAPVHDSTERIERFDRDPGWDGRNNRAAEPRARHVRQDFGYRRTSHFGGAPGEIGGFVTPDAEPAYYGKRIKLHTLVQGFSASGRFAGASGKFHILLGFFNHATLNEWRTPNSAVVRLQGRGDHFYAYLEYCTSRWRAGGDSPRGFVDSGSGGRRPAPLKFALTPVVHEWSLRYDPEGAGGRGALFATMDGIEAQCDLGDGHRSDGATFDRFGLLNVIKSADDPGEVYLENLSIDGVRQPLDRDPEWEGRGNRKEFDSVQVRPRFDFGYSPTHFAGGERAGEIGGTVYRGDGRYPARMAYYGGRIGQLSPAQPLHAEGRIALYRGVSDSTTLFGYFHAVDSTARSDDQSLSTPPAFLGIAVEGPSGEGFYVYPACRIGPDQLARNRGPDLPRIYPDGRSHAWRLDYVPPAGTVPGTLTLTMDGMSARLPIDFRSVSSATRFDRFGFITTRIDGNGQRIYFDDLKFTSALFREDAN